ncbi:polypeptide N-acetylgalactosaminyltransferase 5-like [Babylonia areolata]|uniref:polypeptide N-acetylgalactosaminyltransferase 5-like n=1 Tax=Babylonia areolata TaxID=304850 RepID=UPI003FD10028
MRRSSVLYVPVLLFLPTVIVLYVLTEVSLDIAINQAQSRRGLRSKVVPVSGMPRPPIPSLDKPGGDPHPKVYRPQNHRQVVLPAKPEDPGERLQEGEQLKADGMEEKGAGHQVTFPPFVDEISELGAEGREVEVKSDNLTEEDKARFNAGWKHNSFNQYVSDLISVHRPLPHGWSPQCQKKTFRSDLPEVSVIIIFHNEAWTVLLRSVHSVLSRTPSNLLREVILVDDMSTMGHLKEPLEEYWRQRDGRVKVLHSSERVGLTRARLLGFQMSTAPMIVFFDSHIECFPGWFEPLADRIASDPNVTVYPSIEVIDANTFHVGLNHNVETLGYFRWKDLTFNWGPLTAQHRAQRHSPADPIRSPTMPGGLFAISRTFFTQLGTYDPGLVYWGGENIEISFKAWMCYGSVELVPCSHVGHVFRATNPIHWKKDIGLTNVARVAHVWMDDYKNYFLERNLYKVGDYGDVSERQKLRQKLRCRDFDWFIKNVPPVAPVPQHVILAGEMKVNLSGSFHCIDSYGPSSTAPKFVACHGSGGNQFWYLSEEGELFHDDQIICQKNGTIALVKHCQDKWNITQSQQLVHVTSGRCLQGGGLTLDPAGHNDQPLLTLQPCDLGNVRQRWHVTPRDKNLHFPTF